MGNLWGGIGNAIAETLKWLSPESKHERVEDSLISTLDGIVGWLEKEHKEYGRYSNNAGTDKYLEHYVRQYNANRSKLR